MPLAIELPAEVERDLKAEAERHGQSLQAYAEKVLTAASKPHAFRDLPRRTPEEISTLLQEQGVKTIVDPDELRGTSWPEDESVDDFIATVRRWRRGED
jgi:plasmid stability protein